MPFPRELVSIKPNQKAIIITVVYCPIKISFFKFCILRILGSESNFEEDSVSVELLDSDVIIWEWEKQSNDRQTSNLPSGYSSKEAIC